MTTLRELIEDVVDDFEIQGALDLYEIAAIAHLKSAIRFLEAQQKAHESAISKLKVNTTEDTRDMLTKMGIPILDDRRCKGSDAKS